MVSVHTTQIHVVLVTVTIAMMKHHDPKKLGRKGFIWLILSPQKSTLKEAMTGTRAGPDRKAEADAESMERGRLLACSRGLAHLIFL